ncbi:MAG: peptide chain release factor N(5)-glutamine methyltransferase [Clostridia bacterium]|nr:peptide chain release factor N(5)-glutamine methyltransferase [Clostridia bacterium]
MKTRVLIKEGEYRLSKAGVMNADVDAEALYCFLKKCDKVVLFLMKEEEADKETEKAYFELIAERASRIPLQHITGRQAFMGFDFKVNPDVLIPRPETEVLVTEAAKLLREERKTVAGQRRQSRGGLFKIFSTPPTQEVLDLCCGSGAIGISLAKICEDISVTATDISDAALALAKENAKANRTEIEFLQGDLFEALRDTGKGKRVRSYDLIISNPPYIRTNLIALLQEEVKDHEPLQALDGGKDGLDYYRRIVADAHLYLKEGGWLMFEIGNDQGEDLRKMIMETERFTTPEVIRDLAGRDRVVKCRKV